MSLKVTYHAAERFLQRVFHITSYTKTEVKKAIKLISKDIADVHHRNKNFILPSFPEYNCIVKENTLVTILPK